MPRRVLFVLLFLLGAGSAPIHAEAKDSASQMQFCEDAWDLIRIQAASQATPVIAASNANKTPEPLDPKLYLQALLELYLEKCPKPEGRHRKEATEKIARLAAHMDPGAFKTEPTPKPINLEALRTQTEWFSFRATGGTYGAGADASFFTVRWPYVVWEILRGGGAGGGTGFHAKKRGVDRSEYMYGYAGTAFGTQFQVGASPRNEIRILSGILGVAMTQGVRTVTDSSEDDPGTYSGRASAGPYVLAEISYVHHFSQRFALQAGIEALFATYRNRNTCVEDCALPDPPLMLFVGFRI